jgi:predicted amidohydrolase
MQMTKSQLPAILPLIAVAVCGAAAAPGPAKPAVRVCAAQPASPVVNWRLTPAQALAGVEKTLGDLDQLVDRAGAEGCQALALPEDTLGLLRWEAGNKAALEEVLPAAVGRMLDRLGKTAASHRMYLICSSDIAGPNGAHRNTAFFLGRDGREIGRYYKVHPTVSESDRLRGAGFPVFDTPDLGGVGLLICYDMVMPEAARALALAGADIIFVPTMGGAAMVDDPDLDRAAFRTRAVENFVYLVVARRGGGAMIISPQGKVLAEGKGPSGIAAADIDPFGGRKAGDSANFQVDMRARLFRERNPAAYGILIDPNPPALKKLPATITVEQAVRIWATMLTTGEEDFQRAEALLRSGKKAEAAALFERLRTELSGTWIERASRERLAAIGGEAGGKPRP